MLRFLLSLALCCSVGACVVPDSSTSGSSTRHSAEEGSPGRVTLLDYRTNQRLTLLNEAHTDPLTLYTEKRSSPSTKVTSNEIFQAMLERFDEQGFQGKASSGYAPVTGDGSVRAAIEVESGGVVRNLIVDLQNSAQNYAVLNECRAAFLQIYNITQQHQAVQNDSGKSLFDDQQRELNRHNAEKSQLR